MLTLKDILDQPLFSDLTVLTDENSLNREVKTVDITENYDIANFTTKKAFMLTTATNFKDDQKKLIPFIDSLLSIEIAGLGIKISRFLKELDPEVIEFANANNFALIEIPTSITLGVLTHNLLDFILEKQAQPMIHALEIQKHFSTLFMQGASTKKIIIELSNRLNTSVCLLSPFRTKLDEVNINPLEQQFQEFDLKQINKEIGSGLSTAQTITIHNHRKKKVSILVYPIKISYPYPYYLIVMDAHKICYPVDQFTIDQANMILSYILFKNYQVEKSMIAFQNDFFMSLVFGKVIENKDSNDFFEIAIKHGLISSSFYQVVNCKIDLPDNQQSEELGLLVYQWILSCLLPDLKYSLIFYNDKTYSSTILLQQDNIKLEKYLKKCADKLERLLSIKIQFGIGRAVQEPSEIRASYFEAVKALGERKDTSIKKFVPNGLLILFSGKNEEAMLYFIKQELRELAFSEDEFHQDLLETLKVYLDNQSEISSTAQELYLHRNTVSYRIKKCEEILGVDLTNPATSLNLRLALELYDFYKQ